MSGAQPKAGNISGVVDAARRGHIKTVLVNGAECEPFITSDHRTMLEHTDLIVKGVALLKRYLESEEFIIGIEKNKPDAIEKLTKAFADDPAVTVKPLKSVYPQGAKQVLLYNAAGLVVGEGQRLASLGYIIINVTTLAKMAYYMETGMPLVDRCVTVDGSAVKEPKNLVVPVGTPISYLIENCGGLKEEPGKVLYGGPMMGKPAYSLEQPVLKATNAIIILNRKDSRSLEPTPCIHCGRCVENCPLGLNRPPMPPRLRSRTKTSALNCSTRARFRCAWSAAAAPTCVPRIALSCRITATRSALSARSRPTAPRRSKGEAQWKI